MISSFYGDPHPREEMYVSFQEPGEERKVASTRVVSEWPLITVDCDELGEPIGVCVREPKMKPDPLSEISNITRTT